MKKTAKIISILLAAIMALSVFAVSASAIATELAAGNTKETATTIPNYGVEYTSALSKAGEQDWFKFTTLSEDAYYTIALENYNIYEQGGEKWDVNLYVYDTYVRQVAHIHSTSSTNIKLETNTTYYIKVAMGVNRQDSTGNYEVLIKYKLDPIPNNKDNSTTINVNTTYKYSLDGVGDADWYSFTAPIDGTYKISLENYNIYEQGGEKWDLNLYVYDVYNKQVGHVHSTSSTNVTLEKNVTYYVKIVMGSNRQDSTGNYGFSITCDGAPVTPPDTTKTLSSISISKMPAKTTYTVGESFDMSGLTVKATYSDGSTANVSSYKVSGFDSSKAGTSTITVSYTEGSITRTASFNVTIEASGTGEPSDPSSPSTPNITIDFDFMAIINTIWDAIVWLFNFLIGLLSSI